MDLSTLELADNMDLKAPANAFLHYLCIYYKNTDLPALAYTGREAAATRLWLALFLQFLSKLTLWLKVTLWTLFESCSLSFFPL